VFVCRFNLTPLLYRNIVVSQVNNYRQLPKKPPGRMRCNLETEDDEHFGPDCPECRAMSQLCHSVGGMARAMQKLIDDGTFFRLGQEIAMRRERAFLKAFMNAGRSDQNPVA
jgi:hypothetical protein